MILASSEGREQKDQIRRAHEAGVIDTITAVEMQWDVTCRTVPKS